MHLKEYFKENALSIFVKVPSVQELENRLRARGTETEDSISKRVFKMKFEMAFQNRFDVILINDELEESIAKAQMLVDGFLKD
jgi:guanylate kinase